MKTTNPTPIIIALLFLIMPAKIEGQITKECPVYQFEYTKMIPATSIKDQGRTGTCWSFATTSFFESELIRMGKGEHNLSVMHTVRYNYINRIKDNYIKRGKGNLEEGSLSNMVLDILEEHGVMPLEVYNGINYNSQTHNHSLLNKYIKAIAQVPIDAREYTPEFEKIVESILDIYLGELPQTFSYKGKEYTAKSFYKELGLKASDYVFLSSFTHHPYYKEFMLEIPDNWSGGLFYNLPLDEFMEVIDNAVDKGYSVCWGGDMSERSYSDPMGLALLPTVEELASEEGNKLSFSRIYEEAATNAASRQRGFETFETADDHLMHLIGKAKDKNGTTYYVIKNSWKTDTNRFGGYNHLSNEYVKAKTVYILVHKDAIPSKILKKLN